MMIIITSVTVNISPTPFLPRKVRPVLFAFPFTILPDSPIFSIDWGTFVFGLLKYYSTGGVSCPSRWGRAAVMPSRSQK